VYGHSALVVQQVKREWETWDQLADALATLSSMFKVNQGGELSMIKIKSHKHPTYYFFIEEESDDKPWYFDIKRYLKNKEYLEESNENDKRMLRRLAAKFVISGDMLYKRNHDMILLRCVDASEA